MKTSAILLLCALPAAAASKKAPAAQAAPSNPIQSTTTLQTSPPPPPTVAVKPADDLCEHAVAACRSTKPTIDAMLAALEKAPTALVRVPDTRYLILLAACRSIAAGDLGYCHDLTRIHGARRPGEAGDPMAQRCLETVEQATVLKAIRAGDPKAREMCAAHRIEPGFKPGAQEALCALLVGAKPDAAAIRAEIKRQLRSPASDAELSQMVNTQLAFLGDEKSCDTMGPNDDSYEACVDLSAYAVAQPTGQSGICGPEHGLCRALMGEKADDACAVYAQRLRDLSYCTVIVDAKLTPAKSAPPFVSCLPAAYRAAWAAHEIPDSERFKSFMSFSAQGTCGGQAGPAPAPAPPPANPPPAKATAPKK